MLVHGLGAHSGWFEALGRQLKVRRLFAVSFDQVGFGKRREENFSSYSQWIDDVIGAFDHLKETLPGKPVYLMGNSMGALLSLVAADYVSPDGLVLFSPGFDGCPETFTLLYRLLTVVSAFLKPEEEVGLPYGCDLVTRDPSARQWIEADPQRRFRVPGKMMLELLKLSARVLKQRKSLSIPVLMMTAGQDRIVNNPVNNSFFSRISAPSKKTRHFPEAWHDLMFDPVIDEVADEILQWMSEQTVERLIRG